MTSESGTISTRELTRARDLNLTLIHVPRFDTSRDGSLDPTELKCALRVALGVDMPLSDCERLVGKTDKNGDGVVDFGEFKAICTGSTD